MDSSSTLLFTFLMLALLMASRFMGYFARDRLRQRRRLPPDPDYFVGLNYLLNDEPDDAIDVFIEALEVKAATFDTHLALGKLLRRRGKVDRSIELYESLLASRQFNARQVAELRIQLLRSYIAAGLLDRAEQLLLELRQVNASLRAEALQLAIMLYQIEREWQPALDAAGELLKLTPVQHRHDLLMQISHFHCELAERALQQGQRAKARDELLLALQQFKGNVRVYLLLAQLEHDEGAGLEALALLQKAIQVDPALFAEIEPHLQRVAGDLQLASGEWLPEPLERELGTDSAYRIAKARQTRLESGAEAWVAALQQGLAQAPSLPLLKQTLRAAADEGLLQREVLAQGADVLAMHLQSLPRYRCDHCGFELKKLHWACPGCSCWGMVKPISTIVASSAEPARIAPVIATAKRDPT